MPGGLCPGPQGRVRELVLSSATRAFCFLFKVCAQGGGGVLTARRQEGAGGGSARVPGVIRPSCPLLRWAGCGLLTAEWSLDQREGNIRSPLPMGPALAAPGLKPDVGSSEQDLPFLGPQSLGPWGCVDVVGAVASSSPSPKPWVCDQCSGLQGPLRGPQQPMGSGCTLPSPRSLDLVPMPGQPPYRKLLGAWSRNLSGGVVPGSSPGSPG